MHGHAENQCGLSTPDDRSPFWQASDEGAGVNVGGADTNDPALTGHALIADVNVVATRSEVVTGVTAQSDVVGAARVVVERLEAVGCVVGPGGVLQKRPSAVGRVL